MSRPPRIPDLLTGRPFSREQALAAGLTSRQLRGRHLRRLFPRVYVEADHVMTDLDWIVAASLAMPPQAQLSHLTRINALGLEYGPLRPFQFVVGSDLHLDLPGIFLHRTELLPPLDDVGVTPAAAFIGYAASARMIDLICVGDWLLHRDHMALIEVAELARRDLWRPGSRQALRVLPYLDCRARSVKESETRALLIFAGLPVPEVNLDLFDGPTFLACVDLAYPVWRLIIEYEGRQHAEDPYQFNRDIGRYARLRDGSWEYVQITQELLRQPRALVIRVHRKLVERGYTGPAPVFGPTWLSLFEPVRLRKPQVAVGQQRQN